MADPTPLNPADQVATGTPSGIVTINPGDTITPDVPYYRYANGPTYQNSQNRTVAVSLNPSATTTSAVVSNPVTNEDVNSLVQDNQDLQKKILGYYTPTPEEQAAAADVVTKKNTLNNFDASLEGGVSNIMKKPIALEFQQGQEAALRRDSAFTRSSLSRDLSAATDNLSLLQQNRQNTIAALEKQLEFGGQNVSTKLQLDTIKKNEQAAAVKFALDYGIKTPYYNLNGTIYNANTGQPFTSQDEFKKATGMDTGMAGTKGLITSVDPNFQEERKLVFDLMGKYPDAAINSSDSYQSAVQKLRHSLIYQKAVKATGTGSGSGGGTNSGGYKFTATQLNKGANNAGVKLADFKKLDPEVQNFYVSSTATVLKALSGNLSAVGSGSASLDDYNKIVDQAGYAPGVTEYLKNLGTKVAPQKQNGSGGGNNFWGGLWNSFKSWF